MARNNHKYLLVILAMVCLAIPAYATIVGMMKLPTPAKRAQASEGAQGADNQYGGDQREGGGTRWIDPVILYDLQDINRTDYTRDYDQGDIDVNKEIVKKGYKIYGIRLKPICGAGYVEKFAHLTFLGRSNFNFSYQNMYGVNGEPLNEAGFCIYPNESVSRTYTFDYTATGNAHVETSHNVITISGLRFTYSSSSGIAFSYAFDGKANHHHVCKNPAHKNYSYYSKKAGGVNAKYGHFIYTHNGNNTLYVNLFIPSELNDKTFGVRQETKFPFIETHSSDLPTPCSATTNIVFTKAGDYTLAVRHPAWAGEESKITVNGEDVAVNVTKGHASYATINRSWKVGDVVRVYLPMELRYEECPNYTDYIAFKFGPILLGAQTTATSSNEASITGLPFEQLQNVYGGEGRMDHAPGSRASSMSLTKAPLLIGNRANVLDRIQVKDLSQLKFTIDASRPDVASYTWNQLELRPFYDIHHARYMCYWYQQTAENYANSDMAASEAANEALLKRTLDFVAPGEQQSEAGHEYSYSSTSSTGNYNSERYRDAQRNGYIQYTLYNNEGIKEKLSILCRFTTAYYYTFLLCWC